MGSPTSLWLERSELIYTHAEKGTEMYGGRTIQNEF